MLFFNVVLPVFLLAFSGFILERQSKLDLRSLTDVSLYLFCPALVFSALTRRELNASVFGQLTLYMIFYTLAMCLLAYLASRIWNYDSESSRALTLTTAMMNVGNFGLPLVYFAYGEKALDVSVITFVLFNIPLGTLAIIVAQGKGVRFGQALGNAMKVPIFHAVFLALACKAIDFEPPEFLMRAIDLLGQAAIPMMLVILGMQLARSQVHAAWTFLAKATFLRLVIGPLIALILTTFLEIKGLSRNVVILQTSTPSAILPLLYAIRYKTRPDLVSGAIFSTTVFSAITLTLLLYWLK